MPDPLGALLPGPLPLLGADVHVISLLGRVGDGLDYVARDGLRPARIREYAPPRLTSRSADGRLTTADPRFAVAWEAGIAAFLAQGEALAGIEHPHVAATWNSGGGPDIGGYRIGAATGEPLSARLAAGLAPGPADIVRIGQELAAALAAVHARGILHLDVSPDTVALDGGRVQLTDFSVDRRPFLPLLESQDRLVRPGYSPLELHDAAATDPVGPAADVYAACALLYRLITGRDPAPWQERWRDAAIAVLPDDPAFPPAFLAAIRQGMALEPEARFADGAAFSSALGPPPAVEPARSAPVAAAPAGPEPAHPSTHVVTPAPVLPAAPQTAPPPSRRGSRWLASTLLLGFLLLALAGLAYLATTQGWFDAAEDDPIASTARPRSTTPAKQRVERKASPSLPAIAIGRTVSGTLTARDEERADGQYQDAFTLIGNAGDRVELRLSSDEFDPLLSVTGPGFSASNDDDTAAGTLNSRLLLTLPRDGNYRVVVSSYTPGATGGYVLEALPGRAPLPAVVTPALLTGRWAQAGDAECLDPLDIRVIGTLISIEHKGRAAEGTARDGVGRTVRVDMDGAELEFLLSEDGNSLTHDGESWRRC